MSESKKNTTARIIVSIIAGAVSAVTVFFFLIFFFLAIGLFGWTDGGDKEFIMRLEFTTTVSLILSVLGALCAGAVVIIKINKFKK